MKKDSRSTRVFFFSNTRRPASRYHERCVADLPCEESHVRSPSRRSEAGADESPKPSGAISEVEFGEGSIRGNPLVGRTRGSGKLFEHRELARRERLAVAAMSSSTTSNEPAYAIARAAATVSVTMKYSRLTAIATKRNTAFALVYGGREPRA